jgi:Phage P22-like portal protein
MDDMTDDEILANARKHLTAAKDADRDNMERAAEDLKFATGDQYPESEKVQREKDGRPCIVVNAMPQFIRQVTGQIRGLNPAIQVKAADGAADPEIAEIIEGIIRHIEYQSDGPSVYEAAGESAAACSIGHWRIRTDYCNAESFDQEILIERIYNVFSVFTDPLARYPTRRDAEYRLILEDVGREAFKLQYPKADAVDFSSANKPAEFDGWGSKDTVTVAEYYWIEYDTFTLYELGDGQVVTVMIAGMNVVRQREVRKPMVKWAKITASEVLEGPVDIPCSFIPVVTVTGEEWHLGEETYRSSVTRFAKDSAILYNLARSAQAEVMMLQPKAPYLVTVNQVAGLEKFWGEAHRGTRPYLPYNYEEGAPRPDRVSPPIASSGLLQEMQLSSEDMKRTTGIYDAGLGARSNETSGIAINARKQESQNANSIYADNLVKSVAHTGRIIVEMIPRIYDTERVVRILGKDGQEKMVLINSLMMSENGPVPVNDLTLGKYDVHVAVGPSYSTRKEASQDGMMEFLRVVPAAAAVTSDLVAKSQDWPDADRFAERLRKTLPPGIAEGEEQDQDPAVMQQAQQAQAMQMQQQQADAQMQQQMHAMAAAEMEAKVQKAQADAAKAAAEADKAQMEAAQMRAQMQMMGIQ